MTTLAALRVQIYGKEYPGPFLQIVNAKFEERPLDEALAELARNAGVNVVIDHRVGSLAKHRVTFEVANLDADDVVRMTAATAGLRVYRIDNVSLITTRRHAMEL